MPLAATIAGDGRVLLHPNKKPMLDANQIVIILPKAYLIVSPPALSKCPISSTTTNALAFHSSVAVIVRRSRITIRKKAVRGQNPEQREMTAEHDSVVESLKYSRYLEFTDHLPIRTLAEIDNNRL